MAAMEGSTGTIPTQGKSKQTDTEPPHHLIGHHHYPSKLRPRYARNCLVTPSMGYAGLEQRPILGGRFCFL